MLRTLIRITAWLALAAAVIYAISAAETSRPGWQLIVVIVSAILCTLVVVLHRRDLHRQERDHD